MPTTEGARAATRGATRIVLGAGLVLSLLAALFVAVSAIGSGVQTAATRTVHRTLDLSGPLPAGASGPRVDLVSGSFESAAVEVADAPTVALALHLASLVVSALVALTLAGTVATLCLRLLRSRPLAHRLGLTLGLAGGVVMVGSLLAIALDVAASFALVDALNAPVSGADGFWPHSASFEPAGIAVGFALMLVALVLEHGEELQRDTDGLV